MEIAAIMLSTLLVMIVSTPMHELFHLLAFKLISVRGTKFEIKWLTIRSTGLLSMHGCYTKPENNTVELNSFWKNNPKMATLLVGFSGGAGSSVVLLFTLFFLPETDIVTGPVKLIAAYQLIYSLFEGIYVLSKARKV